MYNPSLALQMEILNCQKEMSNFSDKTNVALPISKQSLLQRRYVGCKPVISKDAKFETTLKNRECM